MLVRSVTKDDKVEAANVSTLLWIHINIIEELAFGKFIDPIMGPTVRKEIHIKVMLNALIDEGAPLRTKLVLKVCSVRYKKLCFVRVLFLTLIIESYL